MAKKGAGTKWEFEADYFTFCNCDWGCPCNFNARPTQGNCHGVGAWRIRKGRYDGTKLDGVVFAAAYFFPGLIEQGRGIARFYVDKRANETQRKAIETICSGKVGGGIFEIFASLAEKIHPFMVADIRLDIEGPRAALRIPGIMGAECESLSYPDGTIIKPFFTLPHGIEFKTALATNTKQWWIRDEEMLASHRNVYGIVASVKFSEKGCVA
ncbi:MAG: DUF1326 domain-containing protein [Euryarchaeota archaeon]|nr:DUF1326 domain-containing protein [Euryarchaeota archaeon]